MPVHVEELICNVTVTLGEPAPLEHARGPAHDGAGVPGAEPTQPRLEMALSPMASGARAGGAAPSVAAQETRTPVEEEAASMGVDPEVLAERVYRLMQEELWIARERE